MILTGLAVFLFGTAVAAVPFIPHVKAPAEIIISKSSSGDRATEYYPSSSGSPFISNFIQKGSNVFFKPQFVLSAAQMPPQVQTMIAAIEKDDCKTTLPMEPLPMLYEEPLRVVQQEIIETSEPIVKDVIEINPVQYNQHVKSSIELTPIIPPALDMHLTLTKMPVLFEKSAEQGTPYPPEEEERVVIPKAPVLSPYVPHVEFPVSTVIENKEKVENVLIPRAPEPLELPKIPMLVKNLSQIPIQTVSEIPAIVEVPPAPILRPLEMPKLSVLVEEPVISSHPEEIDESIVKPQEIPEVTVVPSFIPRNYIRVVNWSPDTNVLPSSVSMEASIPLMIKENFEIQPIEIPTAPILPPFEIPKLSAVVEDASVMPCLPGKEIHEINIQPLEIPEAPVLSPYVSELSNIVVDNPVVIPQPPELPTFVSPKLPISFVLEEEVLSQKASELPCDESKIIEEVRPILPEAPVLSPYIPMEMSKPISIEKPESIVIENEFIKPVAIPAAPVLPPFKMPELPVVIEESSVVPCPSNDVDISSLFDPEVVVTPPHTIVIEKNPMVISEAPKLPPFSFPEVPLKIEVKENVIPCDIAESSEPLEIPEAPVLTPYVPIEMPIPVLIEQPITAEIQKPVVIPSAPVLPPFEMPKTPKFIEESVAPCPPENEFKLTKLVMESSPNVLPLPYAFPESYISDTRISKPTLLTSAPEILVPSFPVVTEKVLKEEPASCDHDIVVERILPKLKKSLKPTAAKVLVPAYLAPLRYALF